ncbi:MAG TPA: NUDIX domain-containing protein [Ktedonobacteraceae bacterium]|nr:NUDIX domain-containing protein [Ktedonobacteraceae bacterium]
MHTPRTMITFKSQGIHFTYRVGGILIQDEHVLCQTAYDEDFFFLPGGRAELGESASTSLAREMQEELGVLMNIERLLYVVENFFTEPDDSWHELGLYFLMTAPADSYLSQNLETITRVDEAGNHLRFKWLPIAQLETLPLLPPLFQKALQEIPECTVHTVEHRSRF